MSFFDWLRRKFFCKDLHESHDRLLAIYDDNIKTINEQHEDIKILNATIKVLKEELEPNEKEKYWNNRKPKADIIYTGRTAPTTKTRIEIDVRTFITDNDFIIYNDLKTNKLLVEQNPDMPLNDLILKIYKHTRTKSINPYKYVYDNQLFGIGELWMFPFELRYYKKGDCDDWAIELASYLLMAGIPYWRIRCVAGDTWGGIGHLTVYVIADDLETWVHLNSTTAISNIKANDLLQLPFSNDPTDNIGIKNVWFSFNNKFAWHTFETKTAEKSFKKEKGMKNIKIIPKR